MPLTLVAPDVEKRLRSIAARRGLTPEAVLLELVTTHLLHQEAPLVTTPAGTQVEREKAAEDQWVIAFDEWIDSHPPREPLPENAFDRSSFYDGFH